MGKSPALLHVTGWHPLSHPQWQIYSAMILRPDHKNLCTELTLSHWKDGSYTSDNNNRQGMRTLGFCLSTAIRRLFWWPVYRELKNSGLGDTKHFHKCLTEYAPHHLLPRLCHRDLGSSIPVVIISQTKLSVQPKTRRHKRILRDHCYLLLQVVTGVGRAAKCEWHTCRTISNFLNSP